VQFKQDTPAADQGYSSAVWANTVAAGTLVAGLLCPFIGALVDVYSIRKATVFVTGTIMALLLTLFAFLDTSQVRLSPKHRTHLI
jgi:MFS-type transporter involved in bile tolerance (Atg22 family)